MSAQYLRVIRCAGKMRIAAFLLMSIAGLAHGADRPGETLPVDTYRRAEALLAANLVPRVRNGFITPHWLEGKDEFWYRRQTAQGHQFILIDAATGRRRAAFDHTAVANALAKVIYVEVDPERLPFDRFSFEGDAIVFALKGTEYRCTTSTCRAKQVAMPAAGMLISPDGRLAVSTKEGNLWLHDLQNGQSRALTKDGAPNDGYGIYPDNRGTYIPRTRSGVVPAPVDTYWSPDSRKLLVPRVDQRHVTPYPFVESVPAGGGFRPRLHLIRTALMGEQPASFEWHIVDVSTGSSRRVALPYDELLAAQQDIVAIRKVEWASNGKRLYVVAHGDNMESAFLFEVDVETGTARAVIEDRVAPRTDLNSTPYNPVNVALIGDGAECIWFSQRSGWGHLYLYDAATGKLKNAITRGDWLVRDIIKIDEQQRRVYFTGGGREPGNPYYRYLYRVNFDGSDLQLLTPETADHPIGPYGSFLAIYDGAVPYDVLSPSGRYIAYNYSRVDMPTHFVVRRTDDATLVAQVEVADASELRAAGWRPPEEFVVKSADGRADLWGVMYKPSDFDPRRRYPIIDAQYANPLITAVPRNFYQAYNGAPLPSPSSYAELGFIVVAIDARGTAFRSKEFSHAGHGRLNVIGLDDHVAAIRQLAARHTFMGLGRIGIVGHSYGGYAVLRAMLEFPDFFHVGVAGAPVASFQGMYPDFHWTAFHGKPVYSNGGHMRTNADATPVNYLATDAAAQAGRLEGKLLIELGELDEHVLPGQMLRFVDALIAANKDFDLIYLPGRNHAFFREGYVTRRNWDFVVRHLLDLEPPAGYRINSLATDR